MQQEVILQVLEAFKKGVEESLEDAIKRAQEP
jgi:hypothetical protein